MGYSKPITAGYMELAQSGTIAEVLLQIYSPTKTKPSSNTSCLTQLCVFHPYLSSCSSIIKYFTLETAFTSYFEKGNVKCFYLAHVHNNSVVLHKLCNARWRENVEFCDPTVVTLHHLSSREESKRRRDFCVRKDWRPAPQSRQNWKSCPTCKTGKSTQLKTLCIKWNKAGRDARAMIADGRKTNLVTSAKYEGQQQQSGRDHCQKQCYLIDHQRISKSHAEWCNKDYRSYYPAEQCKNCSFYGRDGSVKTQLCWEEQLKKDLMTLKT